MSGAPWPVEQILELRGLEARERSGSHFIEGARFVVAASDTGATFRSLVVAPKLLRSPIGQMLARRLRARGVPSLVVTPQEFERLSQAEQPQGIGAVVASEWQRLPQEGPGPLDCWIAVSEVRSPGNLGTLMRTAAAIGVRGVIVARSGRVDPFHPAAVRASMGALYSLKVVRASVAELAWWRRRFAPAVVGATPQASVDYRAFSYRRPLVVVLGSERKGLSDDQLALCEARVRIPMVAGDSLNLAVAGSIVLYEAWRQFRPTGARAAPGVFGRAPAGGRR